MDAETDTALSRTMTREWYPLRLTTTIRPLVHGGRALSEALGRSELPRWSIAESWEVCDSPTGTTYVTNGRFSGWSLQDLVEHHPRQVLGRPGADRFPVFAKFLDATGVGPLQMDCPAGPDRAPQTTAWHVVDAHRLKDAIIDQDFDGVLRRVPLRPGNTLCIPQGTLYAFGPGTLLYAVAPMPSRTVSAARWHDEDGSTVRQRHWREAIDDVLHFADLTSTPMAHAGLPQRRDDAVDRVELASLDDLSLERWQVAAARRADLPAGAAVILTNVGVPTVLALGSEQETLESGRTVLLPAAVLPVQLEGPADVLVVRPLGE